MRWLVRPASMLASRKFISKPSRTIAVLRGCASSVLALLLAAGCASRPGTTALPPAIDATVAAPREVLPEGAIGRLGASAFRFIGQPQGIAYDPSGKILYVSASEEHPKTKAYDAATGAQLSPYGGRFLAAGTPSFSRDGRRVACLPAKRLDSVAVYDALTGTQLLVTYVPPHATLCGYVLSPDGKTLAIGTTVYGTFGSLSRHAHSVRLYDVDADVERKPRTPWTCRTAAPKIKSPIS